MVRVDGLPPDGAFLGPIVAHQQPDTVSDEHRKQLGLPGHRFPTPTVLRREMLN